MAERAAFPAGLLLESHKGAVAAAAVVEVAVAEGTRVRLALDQGSGSELEPVVAIGDHVARGTAVARPVDAFGATLHATVSGRVLAIGRREAASESGWCTCIEIESDGCDSREPSLASGIAYASPDPGTLVEGLRDAGLAGLGGAAFPTATKVAAGRARGARTLLLNGAECEPWICCDDALMRSRAAEIWHGGRVLMRALGADECVIAVEDDKPEAIAALRSALSALPEEVRPTLRVVPAVYPQGAERQLVTAVTGREVPSGGFPADVGVTCLNVATAAAAGHWALSGEPLTTRIVTVTGSGVARPTNVRARIGTPFAALVAAAGGYRDEPLRLIAGGNMMGRALATDEIGLTKAVNCVFVATAADLGARLRAREQPCIRCGDCAAVCPAGLLPQQIHRAVAAGSDAAAVDLGLRDCIDCGCCDYVCPSQIPLALRFRVARGRLRELDQARQRAAAAKARHERRERRLREAAEAERRAFEAARAEAQRAGATPSSQPPSGPGA